MYMILKTLFFREHQLKILMFFGNEVQKHIVDDNVVTLEGEPYYDLEIRRNNIQYFSPRTYLQDRGYKIISTKWEALRNHEKMMFRNLWDYQKKQFIPLLQKTE